MYEVVDEAKNRSFKSRKTMEELMHYIDLKKKKL